MIPPSLPPSSPYQLTVSETHSTVTLYNGCDLNELSSLANVPLRPPSDYYTLNDVFTNGQSLDGSHINLLAVIRNVGAIRYIYIRLMMDAGFNSLMHHLFIVSFTEYLHTYRIMHLSEFTKFSPPRS